LPYELLYTPELEACLVVVDELLVLLLRVPLPKLPLRAVRPPLNVPPE
jgi:hypothetical protein